MSAERQPQRLHPLSPLFLAAKVVQAFVVPALLLLVANRGDGGTMWAGVGLLWALLAVFLVAVPPTLTYLIFRYTLADDEIVIRDGLFTRTERHIPYARIQNVDLVQNPLHRAFGVAQVRVETASGGKPEAVIRVLSLEAIEQMRAQVFAGRPASEPGPADESARAGESAADRSTPRPLLPPLPTRELAKLGIISNKGMVVVGALMGLFWQRQWGFDWMDPAEEYVGTAQRWLGVLADRPTVIGSLAAGAALLVLALALLRVFSVGWFIVTLHGFTLTRAGRDLRMDYGWFNKVSRTVPTTRVQALQALESPLHRLFGRQSVTLQTVGGGMGAEMSSQGQSGRKRERQWLAPIIATERVPDLLNEVHASVDLRALDWQPLAPRAWQRLFRVGLAAALVISVPLAVVTGGWALLLTVPLAVWAYANARLTVKHSAYALAQWGLAFRSGWFMRSLTLVRYDKMQTVSTRASPLDRRQGMARVRIDTAGADPPGHTIDIPYLDQAVATDVARRLYDASSRLDFRL